MKILLKALMIALIIQTPALASKIIIKGQPVFLFKKGGTYFIPNNYNTGTDYNFVTISNQPSVCYLNPQPDLSALNSQTITVNVRGLQNQWTCYSFDPAYFTAVP